MKCLKWLGSSKKDLLEFPEEVRQEIGYALHVAQTGGCYGKSKPFKGFGSGVYEIALKHDKDAYRSVYIIHRDDAIYVVHCFQKKSKQGIKTPREELDVIDMRLKRLNEIMGKR